MNAENVACSLIKYFEASKEKLSFETSPIEFLAKLMAAVDPIFAVYWVFIFWKGFEYRQCIKGSAALS